MSQNITLMGATYSAVPAVKLPKSGGGMAQFDDTTDADATASDILSGKTAYVNGVKLTGTGSGGGGGSVTQDANGYIILPSTGGGGGGSSYTLLAEQDVTVSTTNTSSVQVESIYVANIADIRDAGGKTIFVSIFDKAGERNGYYYGSLSYSCRVNTVVGNSYYVKSNGTMDYSSLNYGVFPSIATNYVTIYSRYISSFGTLDGTFNVRVYTLDFPSGVAPFE